MKIIFGLLVGLIVGFFAAQLIASSQGQSAQAKPPPLTLTDPAVIAEKKQEHNYIHGKEGQYLQMVEKLSSEQYLSTEGNEATLFRLNDSCKITISVVGETYYMYRTFLFHDGKLLHVMESTYQYPNGGLTNPEGKDPFKQELYSETTFNTHSRSIQQEFTELLKNFNSELTKGC